MYEADNKRLWVHSHIPIYFQDLHPNINLFVVKLKEYKFNIEFLITSGQLHVK